MPAGEWDEEEEDGEVGAAAEGAADVEVGEVVRGGHFERASTQAGVNGSVRDNWHTPVGQWNSHELIDPLCLGGIGRVYSHSNVAEDSLGSGGGHQEELLLRGG